MVFHAAAVGVVMDPSTRSQRFFQHHSDDIICLAIHPNHDIVATGQVGVDPVIHVWRTSDCALLASIRGFHKVGIGALSFNKDGTQLGTVGLDPRHSIALYDWETGADVAGGMCKGTLLASAPGGTKRIYCCAYSPFDGRFIAGGDQLLKFFTLE
eukprot:gene32253-40833_t